jgi:tetratricopeptide (TPR) repeat protein
MNRKAMRVLLVFLSLALTTAFAGTSQAQGRGKQSAEAHYQKGMKAYTLGHFPEAIEEFEKAYELRSEPIFLYNIAQSHRQNNKPDRAIFFYRRYLEADPEAKNRPEIEKRIKDMEAQLNAKPEVAPAPAPVAPPMPQPIPVAPPVVPVQPQPVPVTQLQTQPPPPTSTGRGLRIAGITVGAVGVAGVVGGIFLGLHANSLYEEATKPGQTYDKSKDDSSKTFRTLEWVSFGVGAAAIVTGGVLYYLGASAKPAHPPLAIVPLAGPGTGGAALLGRF